MNVIRYEYTSHFHIDDRLLLLLELLLYRDIVSPHVVVRDETIRESMQGHPGHGPDSVNNSPQAIKRSRRSAPFLLTVPRQVS